MMDTYYCMTVQIDSLSCFYLDAMGYTITAVTKYRTIVLTHGTLLCTHVTTFGMRDSNRNGSEGFFFALFPLKKK